MFLVSEMRCFFANMYKASDFILRQINYTTVYLNEIYLNIMSQKIPHFLPSGPLLYSQPE